MTEKALNIETLSVRRAPGFIQNGPRVDDLSPDVTIIHGPNGAGKTTLARAVHWSLWPDTAPPVTRLSAQFTASGDDWRVDIEGTQFSFQRNGKPDNQPSLPASEYRSRYQLSLHDLLQSDTDNESFAERIRRESAGGYDLDAAADAVGVDASPYSRQKGEVQEAKAAVDAAADTQGDRVEIREDQQRLEELKRDRKQARDNRARSELLQSAIEFAETRNELRNHCATLRSYLSVLDQMSGDELETVQDLTDDIESWKDRKAEAKDEKEEAEQQAEDASIPDEGLPEGLLDEARAIQETVQALEQDIRRYEEELDAAKTRRSSARENIPLELGSEDLVELDHEAWPDLDEFVTTAAEVRAERQLQKAISERLGDPQRPDADPDTIDRGQRALEQWLATPDTVDPRAGQGLRRARQVGLVSAALLTAAGIALGVTVSPLGYGLSILGGILLVYIYVQSDDGEVNTGQQATNRETYEELDLERPESWKPATVRDQLRSLYSKQNKHILADQQDQQAKTLAPEGDLEEKERRLDAKRSQLIESLGAAPDGADMALLPTIKAIVRWQEAHAEATQYESRIGHLTELVETKRETLTDLIAPYFDDLEISSAEMAEGRVKALSDRHEQYKTAQEEIASADKEIDEAEEEIQQRTDRRTEIYEKLGVEPGKTDRLRELCEQVDEYEEVKDQISEAQTKARMQAGDMTEYDEYEPSLKSADLGDLKRRAQHLDETRDDPETISEQISRIQERVETVKKESKVETALRERDEALEALEDLYASDTVAMVGHTLVEHVRDATQGATRPLVFKRARELLATITQGRYELRMAEDMEQFRVYDSVDERGQGLDELSSGTQLQVLLAVRLAFVDQQEQGVALPLLLDETLANSDDRRAEVIIDAVIELVRDGRQVLYFTAQGDEVAKWREALEATTGVEYETVDLAAQQGLQEAVDVPSLEAYQSDTEGPPAPDGRDHATYGDVLDVPTFNPRQGAGSAHLWYVIEDVDLLYELLNLGVDKWGQLRTLASETNLEAVSAEEALDEALALGNGLEAFIEAWQVDRGEYVDRHAIETTSAVTQNFEDEVSDLAKELDGDGAALVTALRNGEVSRFRESKADELEEYFIKEGYIDPAEPIEPAEVRVRVVNRLVKEGISEGPARQQARRLLSRLNGDVEAPIREASE